VPNDVGSPVQIQIDVSTTTSICAIFRYSCITWLHESVNGSAHPITKPDSC